jgi:hypothetical protein
VGGVTGSHLLFRRFRRFFAGDDRFAAGSVVVAAAAGTVAHGDSPSRVMFSQESKKSEWLCKKRQMQGAQFSRNEAYSGTPQ